MISNDSQAKQFEQSYEFEEQPLTGSKPTQRMGDSCSQFEASSEMSYAQMGKDQQDMRTQNIIQAESNMYKLFLGIALVAFP